MASENKKINELADDDEDVTAELEALTVRLDEAEADANTFGFENIDEDADAASIAKLRSDLRKRSETIERLQFDIEQLRARWLGLEAEIKAREELTTSLGKELDDSRSKLRRKKKLLGERDKTIKALKAEIRDRNEAFRELEDAVREKEQRLSAGQLASNDAALRELQAQQARTEAYADELRRQLNEVMRESDGALSQHEKLTAKVADAQQTINELEARLAESEAGRHDALEALASAHKAHEQEIRTLRFELGEAEQTLAQNEDISEQLASDLIETRSYRDELERMLGETEQQSTGRIEELEKQVAMLEGTVEDYEEKLEGKSEAISCLLAELAKKSQEFDSIGEIENVIHEIDDRMSERIDERATDQQRVTRLLIGRVGDQELRFPLFKDRLTIGRTGANDIQLKAQYISRRHAVIVTEGDVARIVDWGSKNGVYVNSERITEHFLKNGDIVTIGTAEFRYEERPKRDS